MTKGLIIASPGSGGGKTVLTMSLLRLLKNRGANVTAVKTGPDYIDAAFHAAATGSDCVNLDTWGIRPENVEALIGCLGSRVVVEGAMGLFDGASTGEHENRDGSTASIAALTGWPVILVVNVKGQAASAAALVRGFATHRKGVKIAGVVFNHVAGERHEKVLRAACEEALPEIPVLGCLPTLEALDLPSRHLGLVQAGEHPDISAFLDRAAEAVAQHVDLKALADMARGRRKDSPGRAPVLIPPLGQRIAVARDAAFTFAYPAVLEGWRSAGAEVSFFSPLANEGPGQDTDAVYLPGGYPELYAETLSQNREFSKSLSAAATRGAAIFAECGGYMALGETLTDADGKVHAMAGLFPLHTSFAERRLQLGYRFARLDTTGPLGDKGTVFRGHEFHYATVTKADRCQILFHASDADGNSLGPVGMRWGNVCGSFIHLIDRSTEDDQ